MPLLNKENQIWQQFNSSTKIFENVPLPCKSNNTNKEAIFRLNFEARELTSPVLFISSLGVPFEIRSNGELIYQFGDFKNNNFLGFPSHLVILTRNYGTLEFRLKETSYSSGICKEVIIGNQDSIYRKIVGENFPLIVTSSFFVTVSFIALALYFILKRQIIFLFLFFFVLSATAWQFSNNSNPIKDLILPIPLFWGYIDIVSLCIMPVAFLGLCIGLIGDKLYILRVSFIAHFLFFGFVLIGTYNNWNIANAIRPFNYLIIITGLTSFLYILIRSFELKKKFMLIGIIVVILTVSHDLLFWMNILIWTRHLVPIGFLIFILCLGLESVRSGYSIAREAINAQTRMTAVREIMQNIAHDIRRPFSMASQILATSNQVKHLEKVEDAMRTVDGILSDIMDVDARIELFLQPTSLTDILIISLTNTFPSFPNEKIKIKWDISQDFKLNVDKNKLMRVFENIIQNAVESTINQEREIFFSLRFDTYNMGVVIGIRNTQSSVPQSLQEKIFQPYFSYEKKRGKGIGLAICKRFIEAHGGHIKCYSSSQSIRWTNFEIYLPIVKSLDVPNSIITSRPTKWSEIENHQKSNQDFIPVKNIDHLISQLNTYLIKSSIIAKICIIDDEILFSEATKIILEKHAFQRLTCSIMSVDESILTRLSDEIYEGFIIDYDLGLKEIDGLQIVAKIKQIYGKNFPILMMTNRTVSDIAHRSETQEIMLTSKPATDEKLISFALDVFRLSNSLKPKVVIVDDENYVLEAWKITMTDAIVTVFDNPYSFYEEIIDKPQELEKISCIILDYFYKGTDVEKENLVRAARRNNFKGLIILSSNRSYNNESRDDCDRFDAVIEKRACSFSELIKIGAVDRALKETTFKKMK